jgi:hypothetical protein
MSQSLDADGKQIYNSIISSVNWANIKTTDEEFNIQNELDNFLTFVQNNNKINEANQYLLKIQSIINQLIIRYNGKTGGMFGKDIGKLRRRIKELFISLRDAITGNIDYNYATRKTNPVDLNKINMESIVNSAKFSGGRKTRKNRRRTTRRNKKTTSNRKRRTSHRRRK